MYVICCRDSHGFLPSFDYHANLAIEGLGIIDNIARFFKKSICYIGIHDILKT